jgi:hypothetical protein
MNDVRACEGDGNVVVVVVDVVDVVDVVVVGGGAWSFAPNATARMAPTTIKTAAIARNRQPRRTFTTLGVR